MALNVFSTELAPCSLDPLTGFSRDGCCNSGGDDPGVLEWASLADLRAHSA